jgi:hypothetical protein
MAYTCMMLDGSEMNIPEHREKWGLHTKFRILPKDFTKLENLLNFSFSDITSGIDHIFNKSKIN